MLVSDFGLELLRTLLNLRVPVFRGVLVRLPSSSDSGFQFSVPSFRLRFGPAWLASNCLASGCRPDFGAIARLQPGFQFPVTDSGLDVLRSLLNFRIPSSGLLLVRSPGSCLDSGFQSPVSDSGLDLLRSSFPETGQALMRLPGSSPDSGFDVSSFRFRFRLAPLASQFPVSGRALVRLPGSSPDFSCWFPVLDSSLDQLKLSGFRIPHRVSCDCRVPAWLSASSFGFLFGPAPLASQVPVSGRPFVQLPGFRLQFGLAQLASLF